MKKNSKAGIALAAGIVSIFFLMGCGGAIERGEPGTEAFSAETEDTEENVPVIMTDMIQAIDTNAEQRIWDLPGAGITFRVPKEFTDAKGGIRQSGGEELIYGDGVNQMMVFYIAMTEEAYDAPMLKPHLSEEDQAKYQSRILPLFTVYGINGGRDEKDLAAYLEDYFHNELMLDIPVNLSGISEVGRAGDYVYYFVPSEQSLELSDQLGEYADEFRELYGNMDSYRKALSFYEPVETVKVLSEGTHITFTATDLHGEKVTSSEIFSQHEVTMVYIWSVWSSPCIWDLGVVEELSREMEQEDCAVVGILSSDSGYEDLVKGREILGQAGVTFLNLAPPSGMDKIFPVQATPTIYFVDRKGNVIGDPLLGARKGKYRAYFANALEKAKERETEEKHYELDTEAGTDR